MLASKGLMASKLGGLVLLNRFYRISKPSDHIFQCSPSLEARAPEVWNGKLEHLLSSLLSKTEGKLEGGRGVKTDLPYYQCRIVWT